MVPMNRASRSLATVGLLLVISLPAALVVVASCVGASQVQQIVLTTPFTQRRNR